MDNKNEFSIAGLYYNYKKMADDKIRKHLNKIQLVRKHYGPNSKAKYYPLTQKCIKKIKEKPRNVSLTFDAAECISTPVTKLTEYKTITYLCKSTSRFFLKPDIGEIFDQIPYRDLLSDKIKAIGIERGYDTLDDTDGEHHLMTATLFI